MAMTMAVRYHLDVKDVPDVKELAVALAMASSLCQQHTVDNRCKINISRFIIYAACTWVLSCKRFRCTGVLREQFLHFFELYDSYDQ